MAFNSSYDAEKNRIPNSVNPKEESKGEKKPKLEVGTKTTEKGCGPDNDRLDAQIARATPFVDTTKGNKVFIDEDEDNLERDNSLGAGAIAE